MQKAECGECGTEIIQPLGDVVDGQDWICLECSGATLSDFQEYPDCECGCTWEAHAKPGAKFIWDGASFECLGCDCTEYNTKR